MTSSAQTEIVPVLVPIVLRAMRIDRAMVDENSLSTFKYVSTNYSEILERGTALPPPNQYQKPTAVGVRLHWQLPRALRHGEAGALLLKHEATDVSIKQSINGLWQWLQTVRRIDNNTPNPVDFWKLFPDYPLSLGSSIKAVASGEGQLAWQVSSWADARHYQIQISLDKAMQPQALELRDARVAFPLVSNRWLILRLSDQSDQKGWLIESDYQWSEDEQRISACSFLQTNPKDKQGMPKPIRIGKVFQLNPPVSPSWSESGQSTPMFLTAVGPGDPTFSMFAPSAENVFTFLDVLKDENKDQHFSYHAYGWYANPSQDILKSQSLEALKWSLPSVQAPATGEGDHPAVSYQTILHGMVHSVPWPPKDDLKTTEIPDLSNPSLFAVGTTSADALAAYLTHLADLNTNQPDTKALINQLITLQTGALDHCNRAGGKEATAHQVLQSRFGSTPGGSYWVIRKQSNPELSSDLEQESDTDDRGLLGPLADLNSQQVALDSLQRQLASKQWTLNAYLHTKTTLEKQWKDLKGTGSEEDLKPDISTLTDQVKSLKVSIRDFIVKIADRQRKIDTSAHQLRQNINDVNQGSQDQQSGQKHYLLQIPAPRFWHPNDPVVLIDGMGSVDPEDEPDPLPCRTLAQCHTPADNAPLFPYPGYTDIPSAIVQLFAENLWMASCTSEPEANQGVWPRAWQRWKHPWVPIFLDWQLQWFPAYKKQKQGEEEEPLLFNPDAWRLCDGEYQYNPGNQSISIPPDLSTIYKGRTVLSSHCVDHLLAQIQNHLTRQPEGSADAASASADSALATFLKQKRIIGQRLSGFHDQLVMRQPNLSLPRRDENSVLVQDQYHTIPYLATRDQYNPCFFPQIGGFFVITSLEVVDAFGQCISVSRKFEGSISSPIRSPMLDPGPGQPPVNWGNTPPESQLTPELFLQQPLGLIQPAQLLLRWVDADDPTKEVGLAADANPVCGWMIPNHLDQSLAFYDPHGAFLGEVGQAGKPSWTPTPETSAAQGHAEPEGSLIPKHQILNQIVTFLSQTNSLILDGWLNGIDETLWMIDPLGDRGDPDLSVLIGRPLAILRLKIALRLEGAAYTNQNPQALSDDNGITQISFPVELGNRRLPHDGVVGYFDFPNGSTTANVSNTCTLELVGVEQGRAGCKFLHVKPTPDGHAEDGELVVTVLMDPRGSLHAATGIMPVKEITIPRRFVDEPLRQMQLWFRVRSLLSPASSIAIPRLSEQNGTWEWWEQKTPGTWSSQPVTFTSVNATLSTPSLAVRDGWLKLKPKSMD